MPVRAAPPSRGSKALEKTRALKPPMEIQAKILRSCLGFMGVRGESWFLREWIMMVCWGWLGGNEEARRMTGLLARMTVSQSGFVRIL